MHNYRQPIQKLRHKGTEPPLMGNSSQESNSRLTADSAWQTAYGTARAIIDIAKEPSDVFLPLKAVVGALFVLIRNYDVSPIPVTIELTV